MNALLHHHSTEKRCLSSHVPDKSARSTFNPRVVVYYSALPTIIFLACLLGCHGHVGAESAREVLVGAFEVWEQAQEPIPPDTAQRQYFRVRSKLLSSFWGRDMYLEAEVILPPNHDPSERLPVCYFVHGFENWRLWAFQFGDDLLSKLNDSDGNYPRMLYVYPNAQFGLGHHVFANSANNGPWGDAFVRELVPAVEQKYGGRGDASSRFLTGHSSGAWSALWLQINYPDGFGGAWAGAPDPVDFRAFAGVDIYTCDNAFIDPRGNEVMLMRDGTSWVTSFRDYVRDEAKKGPFAGQMASFDNVFSPRGPDGFPMRLYDWESGAIDRGVAEAWKKYDLSLQLRTRWNELAPKLQGNLHIFTGTQDNFRLNEAVELLNAEPVFKDGGLDIVIVEGANHSIFLPEADLWPDGLLERMHREMAESFAMAHAEPALTTR